MSIQISTLSNGLRIVTEHMSGYGSAAVGVWTQVGARHEGDNQTGISHFLEHMVFKGTSTRTALQIADDIESRGGSLNAYTCRERTAYYAHVLRQHVPTALDVIADILRDSQFHEHDIENERDVILQEIHQCEDTPDDIIFDWAQELAYPNHTMGRPILGTKESISNFQQHNLRQYVQQNYTPERMILAAAGGVDHDAIVHQAESLFGDMSTGTPPSSQISPVFQPGQSIRTKELEQAHYVFGMPCPGHTDPERPALLAVSNILGGSMSSRLFQKAREELGLCYTIYSAPHAYSDSGMLLIYAGTGAKQLRTLAELVVREMLDLTQTLCEKELESTKAQLIAGTIMAQESSFNRCEKLAVELATIGRVRSMEEMEARVRAVTVECAKRVAQQIICNTQKIMVTYGPEADIPDISDLTAQLG